LAQNPKLTGLVAVVGSYPRVAPSHDDHVSGPRSDVSPMRGYRVQTAAIALFVGAGCNEPAPEVAPITGGTFQRNNETDPAFSATVGDFWLDRTEVTVAEFRAFATGYPANRPSAGSGKNHDNAADPGWDPAWDAYLPIDADSLRANVQCDPEFQTWGRGDDLAINCVTWFEAAAFCTADGGRLPTDAEWNYAAAGGSEQRVYPWSKPASDHTIDASFAVFSPATYVAPVGSKSPRGDGKFGQADLAGNVWEWVQDWYVPYPQAACDNCAALVKPVDTSERVIRGGSAYDSASYLNSSVLDVYDPTTRLNYIGFRCARNR
jgi:formylglycine-generating enzyme